MSETEIRARQAQDLLNNGMLQEAFTEVENGLLRALEIVPITDRDQQQAITLGFQLLKSIKSNIESNIENEKVHQFNLQQAQNVA